MGQESDRVISVLEKMLDGMVRKDPDLLRDSLSEGMILVHMTGHRQNRDEFISEIMNGTLNYRSCEITDAPVIISGDMAKVHLYTDTEAAVYGGGYHKWRLLLDTELRLENNVWKIVFSSAGTYRVMS